MPIDIPRTCGTFWRIDADAGERRCVCTDCGRELSKGNPAEAIPVVKLAPLPAVAAVETVQLTPFYEPDAPVKSEPCGYSVVETARTEPEPHRDDRGAYNERHRTAAESTYEPYYAHPDFEERELRHLVAEARHEMWRYGLARRRPLDRNAWDCFLFAGRAWWMILILSFGWLIMTPMILLSLPMPQGMAPE